MTVGGAGAAIFIAATRYVEQGGIDSPLQNGLLVRWVPNPITAGSGGTNTRMTYAAGHFRELVMARYRILPSTPDAGTIEMLTSSARLLTELLPSFGPSALLHANLVACAPSSKAFFGSSSRPDLGGTLFLRESLGSPWWVAEHLRHESTHLKLYDLLDGETVMPSGGNVRAASGRGPVESVPAFRRKPLAFLAGPGRVPRVHAHGTAEHGGLAAA